MAKFLPFNQENTAELCKLFENNKDNSLLIGDFNFPGINWFELTFDRGSEQFLNCTIDNNFEQLISFPTHLRGNTLDLLFSNKPENILHIESLGNLSTSDHSIIAVDLLFNSKYNFSTEFINDWKNGNMEGLRDFLGTTDWRSELQDLDTEDSWKFIKDTINTGIESFIPKVRRRRNNHHQWMTKTV